MFTLTTADRALFEDGTLSLEGVQAARDRRDPRLAEYLVKLTILDPAPHGMLEAAEQSRPNYLQLLAEQQSWEWKKRIQAKDPTIPGQSGYSRQKRQAVIGHQHRESWEPVEKTPEILPDRVKTYPLIEELWAEGGAYTRNALLQLIDHAPLKWGPWRALKRLFKLSIAKQDWEIFAALTVRFDLEAQKPDGARSSLLRAPLVRVRPPGAEKDELHQVQALPTPNATEPQKIPTTAFHWGGGRGVVRDVQSQTLQYLLRRAWRTLRQLAKAQPDAYAFVAAEILSRYPAGARFSEALEPIFTYDPELWARSITPLMNIVERASNDRSLDFAFVLLENRFREQLKTADPDWILRLARSPRRLARRLAVRWFLEPLSGTEQGRLHELGLHRAVLAFLDFDDDIRSKEQKKSAEDEPWNDAQERAWLQTWYNGAVPKGGWPQLARQYALDYIKGSADVIARDLPLEKVMWLLRSKEPGYRELGEYLLQPSEGPSPYADQLTLAVWTELLEDTTTFSFAERAIRRGFSGVELKADWYAERMLSKHKAVRDMALEMLRDETKFRADDDWVGFHKKIARSHDAQPDVLQRSLYQLSRKDEEGRSDLDNLEPEFLRMLLVHPVPGAHLSLIGWVDGGRVPLDKLGVDFLKQLSNAEDWEARNWLPYLGAERAGPDPSKDGPYENSKYIGTVGAAARRWLRNATTLETLGYGWARERLEKFEPNYDWIRELFRRDMPFAQLAPAGSTPDPTAPGAAEAGLEFVLKRILREADAGSPAANFYKRFLLERHALARRDEDPNLPPLPEALQLPRNALTFRWFEKLASDERAPIREFAMQLADYEMQRWTTEEPLDFPRIKPLLRDSFHDVRRYLVQAMTAPRRPEGHLDVDQPQFKVEDLYAWCFDARRELRDLGMEIILRLPQRFGQPAQLLQLSESNDPRVREMVIAVLWKQFRALEVTGGWQPYARSVVPQSLSLARSQRVVTLLVPPPEGMKPAEVKATRKYLGTGVPAQVDVQIDDRDLFLDFVRRALFQLPPVRQSPKLPARDYKLKTAWRNKRTLIGAVRDLALKDGDFAAFILPLIQEYQNVRGRMVRDASLAALAHIHAAHPDLGALTASGSVPPSALASGHAPSGHGPGGVTPPSAETSSSSDRADT